MKVGDYVRTPFGITQIKKNVCLLDEVIKSSPNIIDLIEVGDYVNKHKVVDIAQAPKKAIYVEDNEQKCGLIPITNEDISSVLTKEQFESMEYKIGE